MPDYDFYDRETRKKYEDCKDMIDESDFTMTFRDNPEIKDDFRNMEKEQFLLENPSYSGNEYDNTLEVDDFKQLGYKVGSDDFTISESDYENFKQGGRLTVDNVGSKYTDNIFDKEKRKRLSLKDLYGRDSYGRLSPKRRFK